MGNRSQDKTAEEEEGEEERERMLFEHSQIAQGILFSSLQQALQQQQWHEREAALAEIRYSRKKPLKKLKEYKG